MLRKCLFLVVFVAILALPAVGQATWEIPYKPASVRVDGHLSDWDSIEGIVMAPGQPGIEGRGIFKASDDVKFTLKALWHESGLYLAIFWEDDVWDVSKVRRSDAVFVTSNRERLDRMYFFDNFKFQLKEIDFDYLLWTSPRIEDKGPYYWQRLLLGKAAREGAPRTPVMTPRETDTGVAMEIQIPWDAVKLKSKRLEKKGMGLTLIVTDSDFPDRSLDAKIDARKYLSWVGRINLAKRPKSQDK